MIRFTSNLKWLIAFDLPTIPFNLLTTEFNLLKTWFNFLTTAFYLLTTAFNLLTSAFYFLTTTFKLLTSAFNFLTTAFHSLTSTFNFLKTTFNRHNDQFDCPNEHFTRLTTEFDLYYWGNNLNNRRFYSVNSYADWLNDGVNWVNYHFDLPFMSFPLDEVLLWPWRSWAWRAGWTLPQICGSERLYDIPQDLVY